MSIVIADMAQGHLDEVVAIEKDIFPDPWPRSMFCQDLGAPYGLCLVALAGGAVAGYVNAWVVSDECTINRLGRAAGFRGSGVGTLLLRKVLERAAQRGAGHLHIEVRESNAAALRFYERSGFRRSGLRRAYYAETREDAVLMSMDIAQHGKAQA